MATINRIVAVTVRALLAERGASHAEFFTAVGLSDRTGARRLAGTSSWTTDELGAAAAFLGVPLSTLVADADRKAVSA